MFKVKDYLINFITKNFEDKKINFWNKNKIINNNYLR